MWSDFGFNIPISEGRFWLDNGIIKGFTHDGELHKLYKYRVCDDLTVNITEHKDFKSTIKSSFYSNIIFLLIYILYILYFHSNINYSHSAQYTTTVFYARLEGNLDSSLFHDNDYLPFV